MGGRRPKYEWLIFIESRPRRRRRHQKVFHFLRTFVFFTELAFPRDLRKANDATRPFKEVFSKRELVSSRFGLPPGHSEPRPPGLKYEVRVRGSLKAIWRKKKSYHDLHKRMNSGLDIFLPTPGLRKVPSADQTEARKYFKGPVGELHLDLTNRFCVLSGKIDTPSP